MRPIILFCVASLLHNRCAVAHKWPPKAFCLTAAIPRWRGCSRRVFTQRESVDRVRPVDVGFQVNVHCVSVRAVMKKSSIVIIASCCAGFILGAVIWFVLPLLVPQFSWPEERHELPKILGGGYTRETFFYLWSCISAALGGFIGYLFSRLIK